MWLEEKVLMDFVSKVVFVDLLMYFWCYGLIFFKVVKIIEGFYGEDILEVD